MAQYWSNQLQTKTLILYPYLIHPFKFNGHLNKTPYISGTDQEQRGGSFY